MKIGELSLARDGKTWAVHVKVSGGMVSGFGETLATALANLGPLLTVEHRRAVIRETLKTELPMYDAYLGDTSNPDYIGDKQIEDVVSALAVALEGV